MNEAVGVIGVFIIFGISSLVEGLFIYIVLPETKNRTLQEIEDYFQVCIMYLYIINLNKILIIK